MHEVGCHCNDSKEFCTDLHIIALFGWLWLVAGAVELICCVRKILVADWWLLVDANLV